MELLIEKRDQIRKFRKRIVELQNTLATNPNMVIGEKLDEMFPLKHSFGDGIYIREILLPKNTIIIGKIHKHCHPYFIMEGHCLVATEEGIEELKAPHNATSPAGVKRAVFAIEDTRWITVHVTDKTNLEEIEEEIIAKEFFDFKCFKYLEEVEL